MSEITKLYENAGILKECLSPCYINKTWRKAHDCPNCDNRENYPPFTAEKQIELIKWIFKSDYYITYSFWNNKYGYNVQYEDKDELIEDENFENSLAKVINFIWNFITEEEKQQVKGILE